MTRKLYDICVIYSLLLINVISEAQFIDGDELTIRIDFRAQIEDTDCWRSMWFLRGLFYWYTEMS